MKAKEWRKLMSGVLQNTLQTTQLRLYGNGARIEFLDKLASRDQIAKVALYDAFGEKMAFLVVFPRLGGSMSCVKLWLELESVARFNLGTDTKKLRSLWEQGMRKTYGLRIGTDFRIQTRFGRLDDLAELLLQQ